MEDWHIVIYISRKQLSTRGMVSASWAYNGGFNSLSCLGLPPTRAQAFVNKDEWQQEDTGGQDRMRKDITTLWTTNKQGR